MPSTKPVSGDTRPARAGKRLPRLPHERDESADSQPQPPTEVMQQAHDDLERGLQDTDKGVPMSDLYRKTLRTTP